MTFKYAYTLPIICSVLFLVTFFTTYIISVCKKDVVPLIPYISDTGTWSPESCIFGLMLNIGAVIQGIIVYIRYRQLQNLLQNQTLQFLTKYNNHSLIQGIIASFGVCIVGNFQETNVFAVHVFGAVMAFGLGSVYMCVQTYIAFKIYPNFGDKTTNVARLVLCITSSVMFLLTFSLAAVSLRDFKGEDTTKWTKEDGGYVVHCVSVVTEWVLAMSVMVFLLLFTKEFKTVSISEPLIDEIP